MTPDDRHRPPSDPPPRARDLAQLADRIGALEERVHAMEVTEAVHHAEVIGKLNTGSESFSAGRSAVADLRTEVEKLQPRRSTFISVAGFVLSVAIVVVAVVNTASTYVDRPSLERAYDKLDAQDDEQRDELNAQRDRLTRSVLAIEQLQKEHTELMRRIDIMLEQSARERRSQ